MPPTPRRAARARRLARRLGIAGAAFTALAAQLMAGQAAQAHGLGRSGPTRIQAQQVSMPKPQLRNAVPLDPGSRRRYD